MTTKHRNGFTLTELVVVIIFIVLLVLFLLPIGQCPSRELAKRVQCATQLNGIAKSMMMYANDYNDKFPVIGNPAAGQEVFGNGFYNKPDDFSNTRWINPKFSDWDQQPTIGSCLYLLVKYTDLTPKMFLCPSSDDNEMNLDIARDECLKNGWPAPADWKALNDFHSMRNLSYSYNNPWHNPLDALSPADLVLMVDKSPAYDTDTGQYVAAADKSIGGRLPMQNHPVTGDNTNVLTDKFKGGWSSEYDENSFANSQNHPERAIAKYSVFSKHFPSVQNVLFADTHVKRYESPLVGIDQDNIFTRWDSTLPVNQQKAIGRWDQGHADDINDSYLGN